MCGSKQQCSHLMFDKLSSNHEQRHAETTRRPKLGLKIVIPKDTVRDNTHFSVKSKANDARLSRGLTAELSKSKHELAHKKVRQMLSSPVLTSSVCRWPASSTEKRDAEINQAVSLRGSQEERSSMFSQSGNLEGRTKRCRTNDDVGLSSDQKRRKTDVHKEWEAMDAAQRLPSPLCNYVYSQEVTQYSGNHFRELTSAGFSPLVSTRSPHETSNVALSAFWRCKANYRRQWRDDMIEWKDLDIQIINQNVGVFNRVLQKLLIKCIDLQRQRYSIYIPSWTDTTIRIHDASCGSYRTEQNTTVCSETGRSYISTRYRCQKDTDEPTQNSVGDSSCQQLESEAAMIRAQQRVRSQIRIMKHHWLSLPRKHQQLLEDSRRFILVLNKHLKVMFVSENVSRHLGYQQEDMLGCSIGQFIHPKQMPELLRLTRGKHFQTDDKHCFPLWKTGKVITVAMKFCLQTARTGLQDTGYKPVLWTVNVRLRKRGQCVRAQDVVILCKPINDCSATGLQMSENMLINPSDLSCNFHVCNFSYELAKRTLHHKTKTLNGIKWLCLGKECDLLYVNHEESNHLKKISHNCLRTGDSDLILKQLLQLFHLHLHVCSSCVLKWTKMNEISSNNFQSSAVKSYASIALKTSRSIYKNYKIRKLLNNCLTSACRASYGFDNMCSFSAACISRFTKARTILHHEDEKSQAVINMFNTHCGKSLSPDLGSNQKCFSAPKLPLHTATSFNFLTQASAFPDIARPHLLTKASLKQENTPTNELMSDIVDVDLRSTCQSVTDVVLAELRTESQPESPTEISVQESFIIECIESPTEIITSTNQSDHSLSKSLHLPHDLKDESTLELSSCQCHSYASSICNLPGHVTSVSCSKTESSSLSSILRMENISPLLVRRKINEDMLSQTCPTVSSSTDSTARSNHTVRNRSNTLLHSFLLDLANTSAYSSGTLCNNVSPPKEVLLTTSDVHHQASTTVATLFSPVNCWSSPNNQMSSASTSTSAGDDSLQNSAQSQVKVRTNTKIASLLTESIDEQEVYVNKVPTVSSKMSNQKSDPFLSQASFSDFNSFPNTDMFDDLASDTCSVTSPLLSSVTSQIESGTDEEPQSHHLKDKFSSSNFQTFLDPVPESTSFVSESLSDLDSLLNTIPVNHATNIQTSFFSGWSESDASQSSDSMSFSNYFFNNEACHRPSLLRKLLDKEASYIQEPANDVVRAVDQIPKKNSDVKKTKIHYGSSITQHSDCKQLKNNKNTIRRSVELPKIRLNQRQMMQFNKYKPQFQKPTKELPLPSSIKAAGTSPSSLILQQDPVASRVAGPASAMDKEMRKCAELGSSDDATNCELPDDLIDMAVECCAPLEMDQTEALISDLNDSCSWEDNLYSLLESSGQENSGNDSSNESPQQTSKAPSMTCELLSNFFHSKDSFSAPLSTSPTRAESSFLYKVKSNKDKSKSSSSQTVLPSQKKITSQTLNKINLYSSDVPKVSTTNCTNTTGKMSLLRAAITSDVDKLIEQIPLRNTTKTTCTLNRSSEENEDDPDIQITKVSGLKENHDLSSTHRLYHKINKVITARPETTSKALTCKTAKPPETTSLCKSLHSSKTAVSTSCNALSPPSVQTFKTSVSAKSCDKWKLLQNASSCEHCGNTPKTPSIINPLVIKISIGSSSTPKVICANSGFANNLSQHLKPDYQNRVCDKSSNPSFCRAPKSTSTDLSSTQPVSVMIMRKENHRSRRSKTIAIQTDNEPGEVYPEFEHNPSDTILYPSTIIMYPSAVSSPQDISPLSTPLSSYSSLSDIDKFLPSHPSMDDSSSSADDDYRTISSTPFLWKLLTGELSKDHYQRLDQQMIEKERKKSLLQ